MGTCAQGEEDMSSYTEGQTHMLVDSFEAEDFTGGDLTKLGQSKPTLALLRGVLRGTHEIKPIDHILDLATIPKLPFNRAEIIEHKGTGVVRLERRDDGLYLDGKKVELYLSPKQKMGTIVGNDLRKCLEGKPVLNAAVLDYLLAHPELIPESWKKNEEGQTLCTFFWGTIYRDSDGYLCVRCLYWYGVRWVSYYYWLDNDWFVFYPAALLAS